MPQVVFMSEVLSLVGTDGSSLKVIVHYDTMSGCTFAHNVPEKFNHGQSGLKSELFSLSTFTGEGSYSLPVMTLKVIKQLKSGQSLQPVVCYISDYPTINPTKLPSSLKYLEVGNVSQKDLDDCGSRLMFGCEYSQFFPVPIKTPLSIRKSYSGITAFRSQFSNRILLAGRLNRKTWESGSAALPFLMTVPVPLSQNVAPSDLIRSQQVPHADRKRRKKSKRKVTTQPAEGLRSPVDSASSQVSD